MAALPFDEEAFRAELGVPALVGESGWTTLERRGARPTLDVNGIWGGFAGEGTKTIIPARAHAKITCRLVANQDPDRIFELLRDLRRGDRARPASGSRSSPSVAAGRRLTPDRPPGHPAAAACAARRPSAGPRSSSGKAAPIPVAASFESILGLPVDGDGVHAAERQLPRPERVDGPGQLRDRASGPWWPSSTSTLRIRPAERARTGESGAERDVRWGDPGAAGCYDAPDGDDPVASACEGSERPREHRNGAPCRPLSPRPSGVSIRRPGAWSRARRSTSWSTSTTGSPAASLADYQAVPLGFTPLDKTIGGGLRPGELLLIGGAQGTGKTTMALQMARNVASGGQANVLYICFEHEEQYLLNRMIAMESALAHLPHKTGAIKIQDVRQEILGSWVAEGQGGPVLASNPRLRPSLDRIGRYGQNLFLMRGTQTASTIDNIRAAGPAAPGAVRRSPAARGRGLPAEGAAVSRSRSSETEKVTFVVNGLKDIALAEQVADDRDRGGRQGGPQGRRGCATTTCAGRRRSTTRPTSS